MMVKNEDLSLKDKIKYTLEETRVVLPGTQAILGFQLVCVFSQGFEKLGSLDKYIHLASLFMIFISIILLLSTASFHRIAEKGNNSEELHKFGSIMLLSAMVFLLLGMSADFYLITIVITKSFTVALLNSGFILFFTLVMWYFYPWGKMRERT